MGDGQVKSLLSLVMTAGTSKPGSPLELGFCDIARAHIMPKADRELCIELPNEAKTPKDGDGRPESQHVWVWGRQQRLDERLARFALDVEATRLAKRTQLWSTTRNETREEQSTEKALPSKFKVSDSHRLGFRRALHQNGNSSQRG